MQSLVFRIEHGGTAIRAVRHKALFLGTDDNQISRCSARTMRSLEKTASSFDQIFVFKRRKEQLFSCSSIQKTFL